MAGSLENKITWEELAPSVQNRFKQNQADITKLEDDLIAHIEKAKANEATLLTEIESLSLEDFDLEGAKGQVVRTDVAGGQLYADDNFYLLRAITSPITMDDVKWLDIITLKEVCETWERRSWGSQFGSNDLAGAKNSWKYRDDLKAIANRGNWNSVGSFGSTQKYDEFWIKMSMNSVEPDFVDDDWIGYIPVYLSEDESPDGKLHTIMVGRVGNADGQWGSTYPGNFCLIYDFGKSTQIILDYVPRSVFGNTRWKKGWYTSLYVYRKGGYIRAESSNPQQTRDQTYLTGPGEFINWRMPKTKPANWPQESYDIIKFMMDGPAKIGFWTCSNDCLFYLDDQMRLWRSNGLIVDFNTIYDYDFKTGTYKNPRTLTVEDIPLRSFIYNDTTEQFYWYKQPGEFVDIKKSFIVDPTNPSTTNGPFSLVDSNYDEYDGHIRYYRVYTNGWCEQGGYFTHVKNKMSDPSLWVSDSRIYVKFKIPFKDTNYLVTFANHASGLNNISNLVAAFITPEEDRMLCGNDTNSEGSFYHVEGYVDLNTYKDGIDNGQPQPQPVSQLTAVSVMANNGKVNNSNYYAIDVGYLAQYFTVPAGVTKLIGYVINGYTGNPSTNVISSTPSNMINIGPYDVSPGTGMVYGIYILNLAKNICLNFNPAISNLFNQSWIYLGPGDSNVGATFYFE